MEAQRGKPAFLTGLGGFRALAALIVLTGHALSWIAPLATFPAALCASLARLTQLGLSAFFVLSGFVLFYSHAPGPGRPPFGPGRFALARLARVYPVYGLLALASLAVLLVREPAIVSAHPGSLAACLSLTQTWFFAPDVPALFPIGWAVSTEVFFYLVFPLLRRPIGALPSRWAALWAGLAAVAVPLAAVAWIARSWPALFAWVLGRHPGYAAATADLAGLFFQWLTYTNPYLRVFEFVCGMATARLFLTGARGPAWLGVAAVAGLAGLVAAPFPGAWFFLSVAANNALYAPFLAAACLALAARPPAFANRRTCKAIAGASLSIYLLQPFTLEPWTALAKAFPGLWPLAVAAGLAATTAAGLALSHLVEGPAARRILAWGRPGASGRTPGNAPAAWRGTRPKQ
ncbi:MAG: acyltransferase family protein [Solidesulfovibrio sp. DCME]|uniref:acyltransferase family protein n=1 Tax=Solidesulfovibrio sp. DCME TaxID=3447380 RepID=UPI003D0D8109